MSFESLGDRQKSYETNHNYLLTGRLPVIIRVDGIGFSTVTSKLPKPSEDFSYCMANTLAYCIKAMQGAVFGYTQSDEITFIIKNDQSLESQPWLQNRVQKIVSRSASLATKGFEVAGDLLEAPLDLVGDPLFDARVFVVPYLGEAVNNLIWRQQDCRKNAISMAAQTHLGAKKGRKTALNILHQKNSQQRLDLLREECQIEFEEFYPMSFQHGIGIYKIPTPHEETFRNKWTLNFDLPWFASNQDFLYNILTNGSDLFRSQENQ